MSVDSQRESKQWGQEANRFAEIARITAPMEKGLFGDTVPRNERIESPSDDDYRPADLVKWAAPTLYRELGEILEELRQFNAEYAGERTSEVETYLAVTGQHRALVDRVEDWCERFFGRRSRRKGSRDLASAIQTFTCFCQRYNEIFGRLSCREKTINYLFLHEPTKYVEWLLSRDIREIAFPDVPETDIIPLKYKMLPPPGLAEPFAYLFDTGLVSDYLGYFLETVSTTGDRAAIEAFAKEPAEDLKSYLFDMAADIQEMRPLLVRNYDPANSIVSLPHGFFLVWDWEIGGGIGQVFSSTTYEALILGCRTRKFQGAVIKVRFDGLLCDGRKPWITADIGEHNQGRNGLAISTYVLEILHAKLLSFYRKIDLARMLDRAANAHASADDGAADEIIAASCHVLAAKAPLDDLEDTERRKPRLRQVCAMRASEFLRLLKVHFGCEISSGKGSEVTLFRPGGKKCLIRHHGTNPEVHSYKVMDVLKKLGIGRDEWLSAVNG